MAGSPGGRSVDRMSVRVLPDTSGFGRELKAALERAERSLRVEIPTSLDLRSIDKDMLALQARVAGKKIEVDLDIDRNATSQLASLDRGLRAAASSGSALTSVTGQLATSAASVGANMVVWGPAIGAALAGALALAPAVAVVAPLALGVGAAVGVIALSMDRLEKVVKPVAKAFEKLKKPVSDVLVKGLKPLVKTLATEVVPLVGKGLEKVASVLNLAATNLLKFVNSASGVKLIKQSFEAMSTALEPFARSLTPMVEIFLRLGTAAAPALRLLGTALESVTSRFADFLKAAEKTGSAQHAITEAVRGLLTLLRGIGDFLGPLTEALAGFGPSVINALAGAFTALGRGIQFLTDHSRDIADILGAIGTVLSPLTAGLRALGEGIGQNAGRALEALAASARTVNTYFTETLLPGIRDQLTRLADRLPTIDISKIFKGAVGQAKDVAQPILDGLKVGLQTGNYAPLSSVLGKTLGAGVAAVFATSVDLAGALGRLAANTDWVNVGKAVGRTAFPFAVGFVNTMVEGIFTTVKEHPLDVVLLVAGFIPLGKFVTAFEPLRKLIEKLPLGSWFTSALDVSAAPVFDAIIGFVRRMASAFTSGFGTHFPGVAANLAGRIKGMADDIGLRALYATDKALAFAKGIATGIGRGIGFVVREALNLIADMLRPFAPAGNWLVDNGLAMVRGLGRGIGSGVGAVVDRIGALNDRVLGAFANAGSLLYDAGARIVGGLISGITSRIGALAAKASELAGMISRHFPGSPVKEGPLKSWNNGGAGKRLVEMLAVGLRDTAPLDSSVNRLAGRVNRPDLAAVASGAGAGSGGVNVYVTNPVPETASESTTRIMRRLAIRPA